MDILLATVRTAEGLVEVRSRRRQEVLFGWEPHAPVTPASELGRLFEAVLVPSQNVELQRAWAALGEGWDEGGAHLIMAETVADSRAPYRRFEPPRAVARPRPTAAHPRAYRGTHIQPPKSALQPCNDLRPSLASPGGTAEARRHLGLPVPPETWPLPPPVRGYERPWLHLYWALELARRTALREAVMRLASLDPSAHPWCLALLDVPPRKRSFLLTCLIEGGAYRRPSVSLADLPQLCSSSRRALWFAFCLGEGACAEVVRTGLELCRGGHLMRVTAARAPDRRVLEELVRRSRPSQTLDFWALWHTRPAVAGAEAWLSLEGDAVAETLWVVQGQSDAASLGMLARLAHVPADYRVKFVGEFHRADAYWQPLSEMMSRICRPPFTVRRRYWQPWCPLAQRLSSALRRRLLAAPDVAFQAVEKACHRDQDAYLISWGLARLAREEPDFLVSSWERHPRSLARTAGLLGTLHPDLWRRVHRRWREHSLLGELNDQDLLATIEASLPHTAAHRIPTGLRKGKPHWDKLRENLLLCQLDLLGELSRQGLREDLPLPGDPEASLYAAQLAGTVEENRRVLRSVLRRYAATGQLSHPENARWLRAHPRLDVSLWTAGFESRDPDLGVVLSTETDPLEVLRMGAYAGSCLSLGGGFAHSAAAAMLDVNKQVVYARNLEGRVLARQLLAISKAGELVPFHVYPARTPHWLERLLRDHHRELARRLGLPVCQHDDYEIELLAAESWWDDGRFVD